MKKIGQMLLLGWQGAGAQGVNASGGGAGGRTGRGRRDRLHPQCRDAGRAARDIDEPSGAGARRGACRRCSSPWTRRAGASAAWGRRTSPARRPPARSATRATPAEARAAAYRHRTEQLRPLGINWDFAPVLDVNNNPKNPVIGDRSYGDDPQQVAAMGIAALRGFQEDGGILACGKHFPGHGDTDTDSHFALPSHHPRAGPAGGGRTGPVPGRHRVRPGRRDDRAHLVPGVGRHAARHPLARVSSRACCARRWTFTG